MKNRAGNKALFFQEAQLHLQKLLTAKESCKDQYIFGLPSEKLQKISRESLTTDNISSPRNANIYDSFCLQKPS